MLNRWAVVFLLTILPGCGGGGSTPAAPPPVTTPPTTQPPNFSGIYSGPMLYNVQGLAELRVTGSTTVNHSGSAISYTDLVITYLGSPTVLGLGNATLSGSTATGTHSYQSVGCGIINVQTISRFASPLMNLTVELASQSCAASRTVGELSR